MTIYFGFLMLHRLENLAFLSANVCKQLCKRLHKFSIFIQLN